MGPNIFSRFTLDEYSGKWRNLTKKHTFSVEFDADEIEIQIQIRTQSELIVEEFDLII